MSPLFKSALVLGLLSAVGPFAIDMFLPALPAIADGLNADVAATQGTISFYFIAFGLSQLIYGPLSDQIGRKMPLYIGLTLFIAGSLMASIAPTISTLILARMLQGIGAASLMVVTRAIIRDQYTGYDATRLMSLIMLVFSISPMFAPLAGAGLIALTGWRAIFAVLAGAGVLAMLISIFILPETLKKEHRVPIRLATLAQGAKTLLRDPVFMGLTFIGAFCMASFFVFISSASFIYAETFGLTPTQFSLAFAVNAMGFIGASQGAPNLLRRYGALKVISVGIWGYALALSVLFALTFTGNAGLWSTIGMLIVTFAFVGLVIPTTMVAALDPHGEIAGLAASLGGTMQMIAAGAVVAFAGQFFDGTPMPMIGAMLCCALIALLLLAYTLPRARMAFAP